MKVVLIISPGKSRPAANCAEKVAEGRMRELSSPGPWRSKPGTSSFTAGRDTWSSIAIRGRFLLRVDGRMAVRPFGDAAWQKFDIDGRPFVLTVSGGAYKLEDKGSRYIDAGAPRPSANLGQITISRGLEQVVTVTDDVVSAAVEVAGKLDQAIRTTTIQSH